MSFGDAYVESAVRHAVHQYVHRATAWHGGSDPHNQFILFCKLRQCMTEHILEKRWHSVRIGYNPFSRYRVKFTRSMPYGGLFLCRTESFSFDGV